MENKCSDPNHSALASVCSALCFILFAFCFCFCSAFRLLCSLLSALLLLSFFTIYLFKHSVGSSFRRIWSHSFYSSFLPSVCSALPALLFLLRSALPAMLFLLCSALPAMLCSMGGLTLSQKNSHFHSSLQKFPPIFQKLHPTHLHLTHH